MNQNDTGVNEAAETPSDPFAGLEDMPAAAEGQGTAEQVQREEVMEAVAPEGGSMFMLILKDGAAPNSLDIAGLQRPEVYDPQSPAHVVGMWLRENFEEVATRARQAAFERQARAAFEAAAANEVDSVPADETSAPRIITDERERTIVSSGPAVLNLGGRGMSNYLEDCSGEELETAAMVDRLVDVCHGASAGAGWWGPTSEEGQHWPDDVKQVRKGTRIGKLLVSQKLCLVHSEVSEALEGVRKDKADEHLPHRKSVEVELADAVIRIFDLAGALGLDLGGALVEKMAYNARRADHKPEARAAEGGRPSDMGIDTSSVLIVGLEYDELRAGLDEERRAELDEKGCYAYLGEDGELMLEYASPFYDSGGTDRTWGVIVAGSRDYQASEVPADLDARIAAAKARFKEATGLDAKVYISPHVT